MPPNSPCRPGVQLEKKKEAELRRTSGAGPGKRKVEKTTLKLREVGPPDDMDIEATKLLKQRPELAAQDDDGRALEAARPQFPPPHIFERLRPAFVGTYPAFLFYPAFRFFCIVFIFLFFWRAEASCLFCLFVI